MYFVLLAAALAILAGVVAVAMGHGGEMAEFSPDRPARAFRLTSAADVAALRLPVGLLGYQQQSADEALRAVMVVLAEHEAEIARLRADLAGRSPADPGQAGTPSPAPAPCPDPGPSPASSAAPASPVPPA